MGQKQKKKLYELNLEQDMKYRGPLSYRHFRILGWLMLALLQVAVLLSVGAKLDPSLADIAADKENPFLFLDRFSHSSRKDRILTNSRALFFVTVFSRQTSIYLQRTLFLFHQ